MKNGLTSLSLVIRQLTDEVSVDLSDLEHRR